MFGLRIIRHRYFEVPFMPLILLSACNHSDVFDPWHGKGRSNKKYSESFGIDWMPLGGGGHKAGSIDEAIPPVYTEFIGKHLMQALSQS